MSNNSYLTMFFRQMAFSLRIYLRARAALFWTMAFPLLMLLGMGTIFGGGGGGGPGQTLVWAQTAGDQEEPLLEAALEERHVKLEALGSQEAEARWAQGKLPALLEGGAGHYQLRVNSYLAAQGFQLEAALQQAWLVAEARRQGQQPPARVPIEVASPGGHHAGNYAGFLLPGLIGLTIMTMGLFSAGMIDVMLREKGGYKRLGVTPLPRSIYLGAQMGVRLTILFISTLALLVCGALVFGIHCEGSYGALALLILLGAVCFISLGYLLSSLARSAEAYGGLANLAFMPLMLLSGVYFTLDSAPGWMQAIPANLPLAPLLSAMRAVFNDGASLASQGHSLAIVGAWSVLLFTFAVKRFRWV